MSVEYADNHRDTASTPLREATALDDRIFEAACSAHGRAYQRRVALRRIGVTLSRFTPDPRFIQLSLEELAPSATPASQRSVSR